MSRPFPSRSSFSAHTQIRVNGKIRAREVRVIGIDGQQLGVFPLHEAIKQARAHGVDLVEIAPNATPPVCRMVDYGKFRYEQAKRERESRRHQHANKVKEIQLSPAIDAHDFEIKLGHAIDFLCDDIKLKVTLRFRGREMTHQELGQQVVEKFISLVSPYGHPDAPPRLVGKGIVVMLSPLPRNKRAKNPRLDQAGRPALPEQENFRRPLIRAADLPGQAKTTDLAKQTSAAQAAQQKTSGFLNNPFAQLEEKLGGLSD